MDQIDRNYEIFKQELINLMINRLEYGNTLIEKELTVGAFDFIAKPIIKAFYKYWQNNDAKEGTMTQINTILNCGKILVTNGNNSEEHFNEIVEKNFLDYLKGDQVYRQCSNKHKNFPALRDIVKKTFITQIKEAILLLQVKENIVDYGSLVRAAFKNKEEAYGTLVKQLDFTDQCLKIVEKDLSILKLPTGKKLLMKTLRKGFEQTRIDFIDNLNNIYN
ncbi:MAG: hypothetical protein JW891_13555 [Candidatus Lokiarchaeota archaeon]|nr:hypothetical protein [Candidatus Lokiarchaeota archaeon]